MPELKLPNRRKRIAFALSYNFINLASLFFCDHLTSIIRSDGPSGFFEFIIKGWIFLFSVTVFFAGAIISFKQLRADRPSYVYLFICLLITIMLIFFAALGVMEACEDTKGYCRGWQINAVVPINAVEAHVFSAAQLPR